MFVNKIWFLYSSIDKKVSGPYIAEDVHQKLKTGAITPECNIWWKGQREWLPMKVWISSGEKILKNQNEKAKSAVWYLDLGAEPLGPLTHREMIESLSGNKNLTRVRLWTVGLKNWKSIYEFSEVMDEMGMSRRENVRAPLMASIHVNRHGENEAPIEFRVTTISVAGVGINEGQILSKDEELQVVIKCAEFSVPIRARAHVIYVSANGNTGLRFQHMQPEIQSIIYDYIKKFSYEEEQSEKNSAA